MKFFLNINIFAWAYFSAISANCFQNSHCSTCHQKFACCIHDLLWVSVTVSPTRRAIAIHPRGWLFSKGTICVSGFRLHSPPPTSQHFFPDPAARCGQEQLIRGHFLLMARSSFDAKDNLHTLHGICGFNYPAPRLIALLKLSLYPAISLIAETSKDGLPPFIKSSKFDFWLTKSLKQYAIHTSLTILTTTMRTPVQEYQCMIMINFCL